MSNRRASTVKVIDAGNEEADHHVVATMVSKVEVAITIHKKVSKFSAFGMDLRGNKGCHVIVDNVKPLSVAESLGFRGGDIIVGVNNGPKLVGATVHSPHLPRFRAGELTLYNLKKKLGSSKLPIVVVVSRLDTHQEDDESDRDDNDDESMSSLSSTESFHEGDLVTWKGEDEDVPPGTVGTVKSVHDDGDVEVIFGTGINAKSFTFLSHRIAHWSKESSSKPPLESAQQEDEEDDENDDFDTRHRRTNEEFRKPSVVVLPESKVIQRGSVGVGGRRGSMGAAAPPASAAAGGPKKRGSLQVAFNAVPPLNESAGKVIPNDDKAKEDEEKPLAGGWVNGRWMSGAARAKLLEEEKAKAGGAGGNSGENALNKNETKTQETVQKGGGWVNGRWVVERSSVVNMNQASNLTVDVEAAEAAMKQESENNQAPSNQTPTTPSASGQPLFKLNDLFGGGGGFALGTLDREAADAPHQPRVEGTMDTHFEIYATNVLVLLNIIKPETLHNEEEYEDILEDIYEECKLFGDIIEIFIPRESDGDLHGIGKVYIEFNSETAAAGAAVGLRGREFDGNRISCAFLSESDWDDCLLDQHSKAF